MSCGVLGRGVVAVFILFILSSTAVALTNMMPPSDEGLVASIEDEGARSMTYRIYDMFEEEWGQWWTDPTWGRSAMYVNNHVISSEDGRNTMLYLTGYSVGLAADRSYQGLIYAPYRWSMEGSNLPELTVADPEFMPTFGSTPSSGTSEASMDIYFQYLDDDWLANYWLPTWSDCEGWPDSAVFYWMDGYIIGTTYDLTLNRPAAELWLGMPQSADAYEWWAANGADYRMNWQSWINDQGNNVFDIFCGYEYNYVPLGTMMTMGTNSDGDIVLTIGHISWGYEILMVRWLDDAGLSEHQPWFEDFTMHVDYSETDSEMAMDAVAQYSLHAIRATDTIDDPAWVWEPMRVDYITSYVHPSEYTPYVDLKYRSANSGDNLFDSYVPYETTPGWFNLSENERLIIDLPKDTCAGYKGVGTEFEDYYALFEGDPSAFEEIMIDGFMELGHWVSGGYDIGASYDPVERIIIIDGSVDFDNERWPSGALYHGAPWIELNVKEEQSEESVVVLMLPGSPNLSTVSVGVEVVSSGTMTMLVANHGLTRIVVEAYEVTDDGYALILKMNLNLRISDAYPSGSFDVSLLDVMTGSTYEVRLTPGGQDGTSADVTFTIEPSG